MNTPPDNPIEENTLPYSMDEIPQPVAKNLNGFMYAVVHYAFVILLWTLAWVAINAITLKMGFASPFAMRIVWAIPLLGTLGAILSGSSTFGWTLAIYILGFMILGLSLVVAGLFGLYSQNQSRLPA